MQVLTRKIRICNESIISSIWAIPQDADDSDQDTLILAHGAGNDMHNPIIEPLCWTEHGAR